MGIQRWATTSSSYSLLILYGHFANWEIVQCSPSGRKAAHVQMRRWLLVEIPCSEVGTQNQTWKAWCGFVCVCVRACVQTLCLSQPSGFCLCQPQGREIHVASYKYHRLLEIECQLMARKQHESHQISLRLWIAARKPHRDTSEHQRSQSQADMLSAQGFGKTIPGWETWH